MFDNWRGPRDDRPLVEVSPRCVESVSVEFRLPAKGVGATKFSMCTTDVGSRLPKSHPKSYRRDIATRTARSAFHASLALPAVLR